MSKTSRIKINLKDQTFYNRPIQVKALPRKVTLGPIYRVIADIPDFVLEGVSGMLKNGAFTVVWSTGRNSTAEIEYGYFDAENLTTVQITNQKKYHEFVFPETYVDTKHFFRVTAIDPATGEEIVSDLYNVLVPSDLVLRSILDGISFETEQIFFTAEHGSVINAPDSERFRANADPEGSGEVLLSLTQEDSQITMNEPVDVTKTAFETNINTTVS